MGGQNPYPTFPATSPPSVGLEETLGGLGEILHITHIPTWNTAALTTQASTVV